MLWQVLTVRAGKMASNIRKVDAFMELKNSRRRDSIGEDDYQHMKAELFGIAKGASYAVQYELIQQA